MKKESEGKRTAAALALEGETVNEIELTGRLVKERIRQDGTAVVTMFSRCGRDVFLRFYCPAGTLPPHKQHAMLRIKGHMRIRKSSDEDTGFVQGFVADEVSPQPTLAEERFGVRGRFFREPECRIYLKGEVRKVAESKGYLRIHMAVREGAEGGRMITVLVNMKRLERQPEIRPGDTICAVCAASTPEGEKNGERKYWEDVIVSDIAVLPRGQA